MKYLINEIQEFWRALHSSRWSLALLVALGCIWYINDTHLQTQHRLIDERAELAHQIEFYYEPQDAEFRQTLERITEYITQTDMYLNVGGRGVLPSYYDPMSFDIIQNHEDTEFFELLTTMELFFNARAEYFDTIPNIWPLRYSRHMRVTSPFGPRFSPFTGTIQQHEGIDLVSTYRAEILATAPGVIDEHWLYPGHPIFGRYIIINHDDRYRTHYAHLSESYVRLRFPNGERMTVERGQVIGRVGNTGRSVGAHLHYGIEVRDEETGEWVWVDPQAFLLRALGDESAPIATRSASNGVGGE